MATDTRKNPDAGDTNTRHRPQHRSGAHRDDSMPSSSYSPFGLMRQGLDEMDRWWNRVASGVGSSPTTSSRWAPSNWGPSSAARDWLSSIGSNGDWAPAIEAFQRGNEFVIRAELPGMTRHDVNVEVGEEALTISGERRNEQHNERDGVFWTERSYGSFSRTIPLPPGAISDSTKATFNNGLLEVVIQAPSREARRGRKIDISGSAGVTDGSR